MQKVDEYEKHALECHALARKAVSAEERAQLLAMAKTWLSLAAQRALMAMPDSVSASVDAPGVRVGDAGMTHEKSRRDGYEVEYFAKKHGLTESQARNILQLYGPSRETCDGAAERLKSWR